jgi:hypothetical protein
MFQAYIILLSAGFCCFVFNCKKLPVYIIPLGFLVGFVLIEELACYSMKRSDTNTNPVHHLYQLVELYALGLSYYFYYKEKGTKPILKMVPAFFILLGFIYIAISFYAEGIYNESIINFLINSLLMIIFSTHFFYKLYFESTEINVLSFGFFWINAGNLIYACGTFFQMGLYTYVRSINPALADDLNMINHVLNYFLYANYLAAFLCTKKYLFS